MPETASGKYLGNAGTWHEMQSDECMRDRARELAEVVSDVVWGGEHGWEFCSDEQFRHLKMTARKWALAGRFAHLPWWRKDALGWPIERVEERGKAFWYLRVAVQNLRKVIG